MWISTRQLIKADLQQLKTALMGKMGLAQDPLTAGKSFIVHCQRSDEKVADFASDLKKLFKRAYPEEPLTSGILLQRFVTGLMPCISQQILLKGKPTKFEEAVTSAEGVEYALNFEHESPTQLHRQMKSTRLASHIALKTRN